MEEGHRAALEEQEQRHVAALAAEKDRNMRETEALKGELAEEGNALKEKLKTEAKGVVSSRLHFARFGFAATLKTSAIIVKNIILFDDSPGFSFLTCSCHDTSISQLHTQVTLR